MDDKQPSTSQGYITRTGDRQVLALNGFQGPREEHNAAAKSANRQRSALPGKWDRGTLAILLTKL